MGIDIIKVIIGFWVFVLGAMFTAKVLGFADDNATLIMIAFVAVLFYIAFQLIKARRK